MVLHQLTVLDLNVEATERIKLLQDRLQHGKRLMILLAIVTKTLDATFLL